MKVIARRCHWTQKLFEDDALYSKHLSLLREKHRLNRYWPSMLEQGNQAIQWATQNVTSCTQFEHWMRQNWAALVIRGTWISSTRPSSMLRLDQMPVPELKTVKLQLTYNPGRSAKFQTASWSGSWVSWLDRQVDLEFRPCYQDQGSH